MKKRLYCFGIIISIIMAFVWIPVAVALTGGRDLEEFTSPDWKYFYAMLVLEVCTVGICLFLACKLGRLFNPPSPKEVHPPFNLRRLPPPVLSLIVAFALCALGFVSGFILPVWVKKCAALGWLIGIFIPLFSIPVNLLLAKKFQAKLAQMSVAESQAFFLSHREEAEKTASDKQARLLKMQRQMDLWAWTLGLSGSLSAFCIGVLTNAPIHLITLASLPGLLPATARIRLSQSGKSFDRNGYADPEDYPTLYALAEKARDTMGCHGQVRIFLSNDANAGIAPMGDAFSVILGTTLLKLLSEQELFACLLHEFGHMAGRTPQQKKLKKYDQWLNSGATGYPLSSFFELPFLFYNVSYAFEHFLYSYAMSVTEESRADRAAVENSDKEAFASLLLKLKYNELYEWEWSALNGCSDFATEEVNRCFAHQSIESLYAAFARREQDWKKLVDKEILARNASHPTAAMRLSALGITDYHLLPFPTEGAYAQECEKTLCYMENRVVDEAIAPQYEALRKDRYVEPLERITAWEEAGKPIEEEKYADIFADLMLLGRMDDAEALCDRAIAAFSDAAARFACFNKGQFLLRRYDPSGVEMIYTAMENSNYVDEGLQLIGSFACLTGDRHILDEYRQRALELVQKDRDEYSQLGILKASDRLSAEHLPPELLDGILNCIRNMENDPVQEAYLLHKQISNDFFTSAVVLHFRKDSDDDSRQKALNAMFQHLDTSDWQFSLFDYDDVISIKFGRIEGSRIYPQ